MCYVVPQNKSFITGKGLLVLVKKGIRIAYLRDYVLSQRFRADLPHAKIFLTA